MRLRPRDSRESKGHGLTCFSPGKCPSRVKAVVGNSLGSVRYIEGDKHPYLQWPACATSHRSDVVVPRIPAGLPSAKSIQGYLTAKRMPYSGRPMSRHQTWYTPIQGKLCRLVFDVETAVRLINVTKRGHSNWEPTFG